MSGYEQPDWANATTPGKTPVINSIFDFSAEALGQLKVWLEQAGLNLPISNVIGFSQFTATTATPVNSAETTTSTSFVNLATTGPTITGLPKGKYLVMFSFTGNNAGGSAIMSVQVNSTAVSSDTDPGVAVAGNAGDTSAVGWFTTSLSEDNNTLTAKYRVNAGTGTFNYRRMVALRYANA